MADADNMFSGLFFSRIRADGDRRVFVAASLPQRTRDTVFQGNLEVDAYVTVGIIVNTAQAEKDGMLPAPKYDMIHFLVVVGDVQHLIPLSGFSLEDTNSKFNIALGFRQFKIGNAFATYAQLGPLMAPFVSDALPTCAEYWIQRHI